MDVDDWIDCLRDAIYIPESDDPRASLKKKCSDFRNLLRNGYAKNLPVDIICLALFDQVLFKIKNDDWLKGVYATPFAKQILNELDPETKGNVLQVLYTVKVEYIDIQEKPFEKGCDSNGFKKEN